MRMQFSGQDQWLREYLIYCLRSDDEQRSTRSEPLYRLRDWSGMCLRKEVEESERIPSTSGRMRLLYSVFMPSILGGEIRGKCLDTIAKGCCGIDPYTHSYLRILVISGSLTASKLKNPSHFLILKFTRKCRERTITSVLPSFR